MTEIQNFKPVYDREERIYLSAKDARVFVKTWPKTIANKVLSFNYLQPLNPEPRTNR